MTSQSERTKTKRKIKLLLHSPTPVALSPLSLDASPSKKHSPSEVFHDSSTTDGEEEKNEEEGKEEGLRTSSTLQRSRTPAYKQDSPVGDSAHSHGWDSERLPARSIGCEVGLRALVVKTS